ncbi:MAG: hypothetical protein AB7P21_16010 [Lautropia sp.]
MISSRTRLARVGLGLLTTSLFLSACGGSDDATSVSANPPAATPPAASTPAATPSPASPPPSSPPAAAPATVGTGLPCTPLAATATQAGTRFDCVAVGAALQWHPRGSRPNPLGRGEATTVTTDFASWRISVTGFEPDINARIAAAAATNPLPPAGSQYAGLNVELTFLGGSGVNRVRNGVYLFGLTATTDALERWDSNALPEGDCWINESVDVNATKACTMPYLVPVGDLGTIDFYAADILGNPLVYFRGAAR